MRTTPWYAAAASVAKAVIVIVDSSGSMASDGRMNVAKEATNTVIDTLDAADSIAVIDFDTAARTASEGCLRDKMIPATAENKDKLKNFVKGMRTDGGTSFDAAFVKADEILRDEVSRSMVSPFRCWVHSPEVASGVDFPWEGWPAQCLLLLSFRWGTSRS